jgi:hypothetical protein
MAFQVRGLAALVARCDAAGIAVTRDVPLAGVGRVHVTDPFGNRIELLEPVEISRDQFGGRGVVPSR